MCVLRDARGRGKAVTQPSLAVEPLAVIGAFFRNYWNASDNEIIFSKPTPILVVKKEHSTAVVVRSFENSIQCSSFYTVRWPTGLVEHCALSTCNVFDSTNKMEHPYQYHRKNSNCHFSSLFSSQRHFNS